MSVCIPRWCQFYRGKDYEIVSPECGELRILRYNSGRHDSTSMIFGRQITPVEAEVKYKFRLRGGSVRHWLDWGVRDHLCPDVCNLAKVTPQELGLKFLWNDRNLKVVQGHGGTLIQFLRKHPGVDRAQHDPLGNPSWSSCQGHIPDMVKVTPCSMFLAQQPVKSLSAPGPVQGGWTQVHPKHGGIPHIHKPMDGTFWVSQQAAGMSGMGVGGPTGEGGVTQGGGLSGGISVTGSHSSWPLHSPGPNPSVKLGRLKKCKLAEVDSDTPVFVDALGDQGRTVELERWNVPSNHYHGWEILAEQRSAGMELRSRVTPARSRVSWHSQQQLCGRGRDMLYCTYTKLYTHLPHTEHFTPGLEILRK
ncbi:hypothetical protein Bbelb_095890 [Branchiostoma belcheri]|nr:hypothetical protein Bbelb_095890 [Branchiostoma belcheri]